MGLELSLLESILLSEDAKFDAVNWSIEDHSTTLRESLWLKDALDSLTLCVLEVFFNVRQLSKQQEALETYERHKALVSMPLQPLKYMYKVGCKKRRDDMVQNDSMDVGSSGWIRRIDRLSDKPYYFHAPNAGIMDDEEDLRRHVTVEGLGWHKYFDSDKRRYYYAHLGLRGWEHVTWKMPHEDGALRHSSSKSPISVTWKRPEIPTVIMKEKSDQILERLQKFDDLMAQVGAAIGSEYMDKLPHFSTFTEFVSSQLGVPMNGLVSTANQDRDAEEALLDKADLRIAHHLLAMPKSKTDTDTPDPEAVFQIEELEEISTYGKLSWKEAQSSVEEGDPSAAEPSSPTTASTDDAAKDEEQSKATSGVDTSAKDVDGSVPSANENQAAKGTDDVRSASTVSKNEDEDEDDEATVSTMIDRAHLGRARIPKQRRRPPSRRNFPKNV